MRRHRLLLAAVFALVLAPVPIVITATPAIACSCALSEPEEFVEHADVIVTGTLADIQRSPGTSSTDPVWYTAAVEEVYLGEATETVIFSSAQFGASCGLESMQTDTRYVFFLQGGDPLTANLCGGTQPFDGSGPLADTLNDLGGEPPAPGTTGSVPLISGPQAWLFGVALAVAVAAATAFAIRLRRRRS